MNGKRLMEGSEDEEFYSIQQTSDGGYIVVGPTSSFGAGRSDFFIMQLTTTGDVEWYRTLGGIEQDVALSIPQTVDGGFIAAGYTESFGAGGNDVLIVKLNSQGKIHSYCAFVQSANPTVAITNITPQETDYYARENLLYSVSAIFSPYDTKAIVDTICEAPTEYQLFLSTTGGGTTSPASGVFTYDQGTKVTITANS